MSAPSSPSAPMPAPIAPVNRAARRAQRDQPVPPTARYRGSAARPRPAQGRRVNPVRRSG